MSRSGVALWCDRSAAQARRGRRRRGGRRQWSWRRQGGRKPRSALTPAWVCGASLMLCSVWQAEAVVGVLTAELQVRSRSACTLTVVPSWL
eukprot:2360114-Rhodomonas_salina.3